MKKILLALALCFGVPSVALAQCNGIFQPSNVCGTTAAGPGIPGPLPLSSFALTPAGSVGQLQTNNGSGQFGAVPTPSGDCTFNTTTGVFVCTKTNGVAFGPLATQAIPATTTQGGTGANNSTNTANDVLASNGTNGTFIHTALISLLNSVCTVSPSTCAFFFGYYSPEWFGALCNGTGNDGPAIQAALDAGAPTPVRLSPCIYRITSLLTANKSKVGVHGAGRYSSLIDFEAPAGGSLFTLGSSGAETFGYDFRDFGWFSLDTTHTKQGIAGTDISSSHFSNFYCGGGFNTGLQWTGGAASSCLDFFGRDLSIFEDMELRADIPIILNKDPAAGSGGISTDHWKFRRLYLVGPIGATQPCILVQDGTLITNLTFDGVACARSAGGFVAIDTTSASTWNNLVFREFRFEQGVGGGSSLAFNISPNIALFNLVIDSGQFDANTSGIVLRKVLGATISNNQATCVVTTFLNVNTTDSQVLMLNNRLSGGCAAVLGGMTLNATNIANPTGSAIPAFGMYN